MELSIVIPVYHTAKNAINHLPDVIELLGRKYKDFEIIFIIDNEQTGKDIQELIELAGQFPQMSIHQLTKNHGQHFATLCGFYLAKGDYIACVDEDMVNYIDAFCRLDDYKKADVFYLHYDKNSMYTSLLRKALSNMFKYLVYNVSKVGIFSSFRVISRPMRDRILEDKHIFWNLDTMIYENANTILYFDIKDCKVRDYDSGYNYTKLFKAGFDMFYEQNVILINMVFALLPALVFFLSGFGFVATILFYGMLVLLATTLFSLAKMLTDTTRDKITQAIRY